MGIVNRYEEIGKKFGMVGKSTLMNYMIDRFVKDEEKKVCEEG